MYKFINAVLTYYSTALQAVMDKMEQVDRSMQQKERSNQQRDRSIMQMERSIEALKAENRRSMNIGPEMDQEIDTNVYQ